MKYKRTETRRRCRVSIARSCLCVLASMMIASVAKAERIEIRDSSVKLRAEVVDRKDASGAYVETHVATDGQEILIETTLRNRSEKQIAVASVDVFKGVA